MDRLKNAAGFAFFALASVILGLGIPVVLTAYIFSLGGI